MDLRTLNPWLQLLLVGAGGFVGSVLRFAIGGAVQRAAPSLFPYGVLAVNVIGCLLIGAIGGLAESRDLVGAELRLFVVVGLLGGFTTYSAFAYDGVAMLRDQAFGDALATVTLHLFVGFAAVWIGYRFTTE